MVAAASLIAAAAPQPARAQVIVLSNSSPHVSVIDARTHQVIKTADIPEMTSWAWNDDNNYSDNKRLWLGMRNPDTNEVEVALLDLDSVQVSGRIPLGTDRTTVYIGKATRDGRVLVSKHASGEVAVVDSRTLAVQRTVKIPVDGGVACDIDVAAGPDGVERAFVPTNDANTVLGLDAGTLQVLRTQKFQDTLPFMLTASPDGSQVWVQERTGNSMTILDARTLQVIRRLPMGRTPIVGTFSPDRTLHFTGHAADNVVIANDTKSFKEVWRARVGTSPDKLAVHPAGTFVYAILNREGAVAVLDARTGKVVMRVSLGTNPAGIFVRPVQ
jgi:YVTN family beta-propeller protein